MRQSERGDSGKQWLSSSCSRLINDKSTTAIGQATGWTPLTADKKAARWLRSGVVRDDRACVREAEAIAAGDEIHTQQTEPPTLTHLNREAAQRAQQHWLSGTAMPASQQKAELEQPNCRCCDTLVDFTRVVLCYGQWNFAYYISPFTATLTNQPTNHTSTTLTQPRVLRLRLIPPCCTVWLRAPSGPCRRLANPSHTHHLNSLSVSLPLPSRDRSRW